MCGVTLRDRKQAAELMDCLSVVSLYDGIRWYGHKTEHKDKCVWVGLLACRELNIESTKGKSRCRKMWNEWVKVHIKRLGLVKEPERGCSESRLVEKFN